MNIKKAFRFIKDHTSEEELTEDILAELSEHLDHLANLLQQKDEEIKQLNKEVVKFNECLHMASAALRQIDQANDAPGKFNITIDYIINSVSEVILEDLSKDCQYDNKPDTYVRIT